MGTREGPRPGRGAWPEWAEGESEQQTTPAPLALPLGTLRRFVQSEARPQRRPPERCELCRTPLLSAHRHLLAPESRQVICVCGACALLFGTETHLGQGRYRLIPERYRWLCDLELTAGEWEALGVPVNLVYLFYSTPAGRVVACYPGPAGTTESLLSLDGWRMLVARYRLLAELAPDVEALLLNRVRGARDAYLVPIDACYRLTGLIRANWRGLGGGREVERVLTAFFEELRARAERVVVAGRTAPDRGKGENDAGA
ncbi:DUF5947 family protein [Thermogemmatispora sp.]|uniref:DUF5947 family protein n=1 Tax=Thermogemmatispora sp. TaxID=1968838 RepID=UPI0035E407CF